MNAPIRFLRQRALVLSLAGILASACGGVDPGSTAGGTVAPMAGALTINVDWTASGGSITSDGLFTAPATLGSYQVQARFAGLSAAATVNVVPVVVPTPGSPADFYAAASKTCATMPLRTTGTTRYFCDCASGAQAGCVPGNDSNDGSSAATPKRSLSALVSAWNTQTNAGDTVALCKGGAWSTSARLAFDTTRPCVATASPRAAANTTTCDLRDYTPTAFAGTAKPVIRQTSHADLLSFQYSNTRGVRLMNLDLEGPWTVGASDSGYWRAIYLGNNGGGSNDDYLVCGNTINGFNHGIGIDGEAAPRLNVWGNRITNISTEGIMGGPTNLVIDSNYLDNVGAYGVMSHTFYLGAPTVTTNLQVVNNEIRRTNAGVACGGVLVVVHGAIDGVNIENNIVDGGTGAAGGCYGIAVDAGGYPNGCFFRNLAIRRNLVTNVGFTSIGVAQAPNAIIENNVVVQSNAGRYGIWAPDQAHRTSPLDDTMSGAVIRNNTLYMNGGEAIRSEFEGTGHVIANNLIWFSNGSGTCFHTLLSAGAYAFMGNGLCNGTWSTTYDGTTHLTSNPMFTAAPTDVSLQGGSPARGAGSSTYGAKVDLTGAARSSPPSLGAYE